MEETLSVTSNSMNAAESSDPTSLKGWSKEDKFQLLQALRNCEPDEMEQIRDFLPNKTRNEIQSAIDYYNEKALKLKAKTNTEKSKESKNSTSPLAQWCEKLNENFSYADLNTEIATALKIIAEYEQIPPSVATEGIDFRKIYHVIANAMEGKPLPQDNVIIDVLNKCLIETAMTSKSFLKKPQLEAILSQIDVSARETHILPKPTADTEAACLKHLASQIAYNPLNISENLLKVIDYKKD